jgi:hypothetical protein
MSTFQDTYYTLKCSRLFYDKSGTDEFILNQVCFDAFEECFPNIINELANIIRIKCVDNILSDHILSFPSLILWNIEHVELQECRNLRSMPILNKLTYLDISGCSSLERIPKLPKLKILRCSNSGLKIIPELPKLQGLFCSFCPMLKQINYCPELLTVHCDNCPNLTRIPDSSTIRFLNCHNCPNIRSIPMLLNLDRIDVHGCPVFNQNGIFAIGNYRDYVLTEYDSE